MKKSSLIGRFSIRFNANLELAYFFGHAVHVGFVNKRDSAMNRKYVTGATDLMVKRT